MWVHLTGELSPDPKIIVDEYQKTRHSDHPKEYYKNFKGILVTDGLAQYHKIARKLEHLGNANCWDNKPYSRTGIRLTVNEICRNRENRKKGAALSPVQQIAREATERIAVIFNTDNFCKGK